MLEKMFAKQIEDRVQKLVAEELAKAIAHKEEELQLAHKQLDEDRLALIQEMANFQSEKKDVLNKLDLIQLIEANVKKGKREIHFSIKESKQLKEEIEEKLNLLNIKEENLKEVEESYRATVEQQVAKEWEGKNDELNIRENSIDSIIEQEIHNRLIEKEARLEAHLELQDRKLKDKENDLVKEVQLQLRQIQAQEDKLTQREEELENRLSNLELPLYLDECAMYHVEELFYQYNDSEEYKQAIVEINKKMENMVKDKSACTCGIYWTVNGSRAQGKKQINSYIKMALRLFNVESDSYISSINTRSNIYNVKKKIQKSGDMVNKLCKTHDITVQQEYINYKIDLATLVYEQVMKKQEEKEEARRQAEIIREQEKLEREIAKEREKLAKEVQQYQTEIDRLVATVDMETGEIVEEVAERLGELQEKIEELQAQDVTLEERVNNKAGWVYVIASPTNRDMVKIGTTRRLDPHERIAELSGASVPFKMLTYGVVFSEDAFALEAKMHKHFNNKRTNVVNMRREWFNCSPQEVYEVIKENIDSTVEFNFDVKDYEYEQSLKVWNM